MIGTTQNGANKAYFETSRPLPQALPASKLIQVIPLDPCAPEGARKFVRTMVHEVRRPDGSIGWQVVNSYPPGVSLLVIVFNNGQPYVVLHDEVRYPLPQDGMENVSIEEAAAATQGGRWSREIVSGAVKPSETLTKAAMREAREESGIVGLQEGQITPIFGTLYSSVSTNRQPFNLFSVVIDDEQWMPDMIAPDLEEGNIYSAAYRLPVALDMIGRQIVELSTVTALTGLCMTNKWRKYL